MTKGFAEPSQNLPPDLASDTILEAGVPSLLRSLETGHCTMENNSRAGTLTLDQHPCQPF